MKCELCGTMFKMYWTNPETGKKHNLGNRKKCLECSPFMAFTPHPIPETIKVSNDNEKVCSICQTIKPITEFYPGNRRKDGSKAPASQCKDCVDARSQKRHQARKQTAVNYLGGTCIKCGYSKCIAALEFHHKDPTQKDFEIGTPKKGETIEALHSELDKCILVCANCHREIHTELTSCGHSF